MSVAEVLLAFILRCSVRHECNCIYRAAAAKENVERCLGIKYIIQQAEITLEEAFWTLVANTRKGMKRLSVESQDQSYQRAIKSEGAKSICDS